MTTLKERLEEVMQEHGLKTQQQLAEFAGVSKGLVGQWFKGDTGLGAKPLLAFETKTNFSTRWLVEGKGDKYRNEPNHSGSNVGEQSTHHFFQENSKPAHSGSLKNLIMPDESFTPTIPQGSELICDSSQTQIIDGKIYQIQIGDLLFIRRVFRQISGCLKLLCDNGAFEETLIEAEKVHIIGRITAWTIQD
ncbi:XRE family transcriptional regulator [Alysiella crassa]|uniref:Bacteriophage CI repressor helix-turn-helix domain n=1 Tax=Alysiella crassa TaxID=153491 RepID=A0A376BW90_9NEIS|nr:LexA family transcriptional regulator [Alysiella crassa]UOP06535.1 helix-turn-helix domain-containing protein [Alysiella crassa]SSY81068.1 Bacteriophage CI repressor helix-turn-helix domain [Alysiella crassa]